MTIEQMNGLYLQVIDLTAAQLVEWVSETFG